MPSSKSIRVFSLGCPKNLVDSEVMLGLLHQAGWSLALGEEADVVLVNTCGFIREAKEESIEAILRAAREKQAGKYKYLVVTGCLPQRYKKDLPQELPEVDLFLGTNEVGEAAGLLERLVRGELKKKQIIGRPRFLYDHETPRILSSGPASAYIKIAEGCSNFCSYCVIPKIRGNLRSRLIPSVLAEVEKAAAQGVKEVNLIAQDITAFGQDARDGANLTALLRSLVQVEGIRWIRLLYAHPAHLTPELVSLIREEEKICKYLDLPIQHIHDGILKAMNRRISGRSLREILAKIRSEVPGIALRTSLMVGFPGETKTAFQELFEFVKEFEFDHLGVFAYSPEEGTRAGKMKGRVPAKIQVERYHQIMALQKKVSRKKQKQQIGSRVEVLIEGAGKKAGVIWEGRTQRQAPEIDGLMFLTKGEGIPGEMVEAVITRASAYDLYGEILQGHS
ncbi:MAG: 30S ribosomal protein S12 methylthiotransferase RimO [Deltaproteobacteria bacterium]|nr:MAG: 30S ribosomal protein S12 methylthiotransferase RimO [Deltaproteobacteria bacterium]